MEKLFIGNQLAGNLIPLARGEAAPDNPSCVTVESEGEILILSFDGSDDCNAVSGTLRIRPVSRQYGDPSVFVTDIALIEFDTGDGCLVNGQERSTVTIEGSQILAVCTYTDLDLCGRSISGQLVLRGEAPGDWQIALGAQTYLYQADVEVQTEIDWQPETGVMAGKTEVLMGDDRYVMRAEAVVMDACGLPTDGSLTIIDPEGHTVLVDFTATSCDTPKVVVTDQGATKEWMLFETP